MKLTPWIDGSIKPARAGVYRRDYQCETPCYCRFDGQVWYCGCYIIEAASEVLSISAYQNLPWRGLAEQPK
jgi:hypothetical protein